MIRTSFYTATTLDGYIADEHDSLDWLLNQPVDDGDPTADGAMNYADFIAGIGALCMGATTYRWILAGQAKNGEAWPYSMPTWIFSHRTSETVEGADIRFASGDVRPVHREMAGAAGDKDLWVVGGGDLAAQFADAGLLDEVIVSIAPVTLGAGRPLFPRRYDLELRELARNGVFACARYAVVGGRDRAGS